LYADGVKVNSATITEADNWTHTFTDLAKYENNGDEIAYTVKEIYIDNLKVADSAYKPTLTGKVGDNTFVITNSYTPETTTVSGTKTWDDADDQDGARPESITIRLYRDGEEIASKTVTEKDQWSWTFDNLDKYEDEGQTVEYTITEDAVENYSTTYDGFNVTNSYTPNEVSVTVFKRWSDSRNVNGLRPQNIFVELLADGKVVENKTITLNAANDWKATFTELPEYVDGKQITYTVEEIPVEGYTTRISGDAVNGFIITNTLIETNEPGNPELPASGSDEYATTSSSAKTPSSPTLPSSSTSSTNTSTSTNEYAWGAVLLAACCGLAVIIALKKKRETK
jgi:hypothetical protein